MVKRYIYIDNYRGFSKTCIPLKDMNFLVGENSTGKSSVISLLSFLVEAKDPMRAEVNLLYHFGEYAEAVSAASEDKSRFTVGMFSIWDTEGGYEVECSSFKVKSDRGLPRLSSYFRLMNGLAFSLILKPRPKYRFDRLEQSSFPDFQTAKAHCLEYMKECSLVSDGRGYKMFKGRLPEGMPVGFYALFAMRSDAGRKHVVIDDIPSSWLYGTPADTLLGMSAVDPIRSAPRKIYDSQRPSDNGDDLSAYIQLNSLAKSKSKASKKMFEKLEMFGRDSGLFDKLTTRSFGSKRLSAPFEVVVGYGRTEANIRNVGYGVSQILPILMECTAPEDRVCYTMQQPEVHLHPRAQAEFGGFLFRMMEGSDSICVVETHSDFIIDRYRLACSQSESFSKDSQVLFFEREDGFNKVTPIEIGRDGRYADTQPESFRAFFLDEALGMLGL